MRCISVAFISIVSQSFVIDEIWLSAYNGCGSCYPRQSERLMTELSALQIAGQARLEEVARHYANQHGLRPDVIEWIEQYDEWWLTVSDAQHTVRVVFSLDEIEEFAEESDGAKFSRHKLRDAFASLAM